MRLKEPLAKQAALVYNLLRKVIGIEFPIALSTEYYSIGIASNFGRVGCYFFSITQTYCNIYGTYVQTKRFFCHGLSTTFYMFQAILFLQEQKEVRKQQKRNWYRPEFSVYYYADDRFEIGIETVQEEKNYLKYLEIKGITYADCRINRKNKEFIQKWDNDKKEWI